MKTLFVVSDVHSFYNELMKSLNDCGFDINNQDHIFISCGDLLDRGTQPIECLKFVNNIPDDRKILIRGNHEDLMEEAICRHYFERHDASNGTVDTVIYVTNCDIKNYEHSLALQLIKEDENWNKYVNSTVDYAEIGNNIFVHGWIPVKQVYSGTKMSDMFADYYNPQYIYDKYWRKNDSFKWNSARWYNGMKMWNKGIVVPHKTIYCGHWHSSWGHSRLHNDGSEFIYKTKPSYDDTVVEYARHDPFVDNGIVALDACTVHSGFVNCVKINVTDKQYEKYLNKKKEV